VQVFQVRHGRVVDRIELVADERSGAATPADPAAIDRETVSLLTSALQQFYTDRPAPPEVHVPIALDEDECTDLETWLSAAAERRVRIVVPRRGEKRGLLDLAMRNASMAYQSHFSDTSTAAFDALDTLRVLLNLPALPKRIECFDISTLQGRETVASMVVCVEGRMRRGEYRKFRIRGRDIGTSEHRNIGTSDYRDIGSSGRRGDDEMPAHILDDFASMHEVVLRRYRRVMEQGGPFPDLVVIDGGKGQLGAAYSALADLGLERLVAIGLAKQEELIFTRDRVDGIALPHESAALRLLQRIRDEAHRFAVTFHRQRRSGRDLRSSLDDIAGIGPRRRAQLLTAFGSAAGVKRASREDLEAVVGAKVADLVIKYFAGGF
jgi:excinuclease ABC subunit C